MSDDVEEIMRAARGLAEAWMTYTGADSDYVLKEDDLQTKVKKMDADRADWRKRTEFLMERFPAWTTIAELDEARK